MNTLLQIIFIEAAIFALIMILAMYYIGSRGEKIRLADIDKLVNQISNNESQRKQEIIDFLVGSCQLQQQQAEESCAGFIAAEKLFLYQFIEQQLKQTSLTGFNTQVGDLLDKYLALLPLDKLQHSITMASEVEAPPEKDITNESKRPESDVHEESSPFSNHDSLEEQNAETALAIDSDDDDLDWNEAFAEAGLEMETNEKPGV